MDNSTQTPRGGDDNANKESEKEEDKTETIISEEAISEVTPDQIEQGIGNIHATYSRKQLLSLADLRF